MGGLGESVRFWMGKQFESTLKLWVKRERTTVEAE
jgi:hypothetical protein